MTTSDPTANTDTAPHLMSRVVRYALPLTASPFHITADPAAPIVATAIRNPGVLDIWLLESHPTGPAGSDHAAPRGTRDFLITATGQWAPPGYTHRATTLTPDATARGGPTYGAYVWHLFERTTNPAA